MGEETFTVRAADWETDHDALHAVRQAVFVVELGIPEELEWDSSDPACRHWLALDAGGHAIATARLKPDGQLGRMAVLHAWRRHGVGSCLLQRILASVTDSHPPWLNAQTAVIGFYRRFGFRETGTPFSEAGIAHQKMIYCNTPDSGTGNQHE